MPFELINALAVFQSLVNYLLRDMLNKFIFIYLDSILLDLFGDEGGARSACLPHPPAAPGEPIICEGREVRVPYLHNLFPGVHCGRGQLSPDRAKVRTVTKWPTPSYCKQLQQFLYFSNFYCCFIQDYNKMAAPLTKLTSTQQASYWTPKAEAAFSQLKGLLSSAPILVHPNPSQQFVVDVDASDVGVGAVLS